ncbi:unnamed protein product [Scytosiphon promiscuus]
MSDNHRNSRDSSHTDSDSDGEGTALTVSEAKAMIRDIMTLCGRQPHKKLLAESRARAQGDPQAAMLSVVPMVVNVAEEALARRAKNKQQLVGRASPPRHEESLTPSKLKLASRVDSLLVAFLEEVQFLVGADPSGQMKKDLVAFRSLLAPP